jgi:hypothetical protein
MKTLPKQPVESNQQAMQLKQTNDISHWRGNREEVTTKVLEVSPLAGKRICKKIELLSECK